MKRLIKDLLECAIIFILVFITTLYNLFYPLDYSLKDAVYQKPRGVDSTIKIIGIDEHTLKEIGSPSTWSREVYAKLIDILNYDENVKPSVIAFDILFSGNVDEGDTAFAKAAKESGNVVIVSQFIYSEKPDVNSQGMKTYPVKDILNPYDELADAAIVGYANVAQDSDGKVRRVVVKESYNGEDYKSFAETVYDLYCEKHNITPNKVRADKYNRTLINYSGKPGDYEYISLIDVLNGKIDPRAFTDSIVVVGAYAPGLQDNFKVPNGYSRQMYGVEIHANILQSFMQNRFAINANARIVALILGIVAALLHFVFKRAKLLIALALLVVSVGAELFIGMQINNNGKAISLVYLPIFVILSIVYAVGVRYAIERIKRKKTLDAFKKYVAPEVVEEIAQKGEFSVKLGGEKKDIAVLFVDIRGFTTMSEALEPETVVEILNQYLNLTTQAIFKNKGTLDKFVGDATMAVFNSPFDLPDYEYLAVSAAMDIVEEGRILGKKLYEKYGREVGFGVGVNCGDAVVGNVGCEFRMDYTAIGDTVNTAARLEANAGRGQVLISDVLYERLKDRLEVTEVGEIPLKGKSKGVFVYSVDKLK